MEVGILRPLSLLILAILTLTLTPFATVAVLKQSKIDLCRTLNCTCVNTTTRKSIQCEGRLRGELPSLISVPLDFTEIDFSRNSISAIRVDTFEGIYLSTSIVRLDFSNNDIVSVDDGSFEMFVGLRQLILKRNRLANVTIAMFRNLRQLEFLDLSYNNIRMVDMDVLLPCISLRELNLRYSGVNLQGVQDLLMSATSMLEHLDLHGLDLERLPRDLLMPTEYIKTLVLSGNSLAEVPSLALSRLKFLEVLDLSDNLITEITAMDFANMDSLEELYLNTLSLLRYVGEGAFHSLRHLKIFSCSFNPRLENIHPAAFVGIASYPAYGNHSKWNLREVILRQNALTSLAEELLPWELIRYVDLCENPWNCDCRLGWMKSTKWNLEKTSPLQCASPRTLRNRFIDEIPPNSFRCEEGMDMHLAASIALLLSTLVILSVGCCVFACWKLNWFNRCRATFQRRYHRLKMPPPPVDFSRDTIMTTISETETEFPSDDTK